MRNLKKWGLMALLMLFSTLALTQTPPTPLNTIPVCDKGSNQTNCLDVPFAEMDDYMYGFEAYIRKAIGDKLTVELANYVTPAQAQSIVQGVVSTALANYSTTAETTTIANNAAAAALQATLVNYSTTSQTNDAINAAITAALQAALANYSTTAQTQAIVTNTATTVVNNALANSGYVTAAQAQAIADAAAANAVAGIMPGGLRLVAWWTVYQTNAGIQSYGMTRTDAANTRFTFTVPRPDTTYLVLLSYAEGGNPCSVIQGTQRVERFELASSGGDCRPHSVFVYDNN